jgi:hypothetical protein
MRDGGAGMLESEIVTPGSAEEDSDTREEDAGMRLDAAEGSASRV